MTQKSTLAKPGEVEQKWYHIDGENLVLGRLAVSIANVLMGKHKPEYTPHTDTGDFIVLTNADKVKTSGRKSEYRLYSFFSGYPSGLRQETLEEMLANRPEQAIMLAVKRMLPKNKLGKKMLTKLKVFKGADHPHQAQQPQPWPFDAIKTLD